MSTLFRHFRVHQVFGANTNVGKTILTTALVRASAQRGKNVYYLKPVSTGPLEDADDYHVNRHTADYKKSVHAECLFRYDEPVSPHLAVKMKADLEGQDVILPPSDGTFLDSVANRIRTYAKSSLNPTHMYLETAGGVHSPALSGTSQADCYRPLFLPTVLIGDSKLGGISSTISSYESLLLRGYIIDAIVLFRDDYYQNAEYLKPYFAERGVFVHTVNAPPERLSDLAANFTSTDKYYATITALDTEHGVGPVVDHLDVCHSKRLDELESMPKRAHDSIWWPFAQHGLMKGEKDVTVIDSAYSDFFSITNKSASSPTESILEPQFDGSASWWTQTLGHAHPSLTLAAAKASGRYGHVMFPQSVHLPALKLAERLVKGGPGKGWASRAFISDNGSTGMEVALKMALRAFTSRQQTEIKEDEKKQLGILGLKGSYHGDTIGAMDACEEGVYTCEWHNAKGYWFDPPTVGIKNGEVFITVPATLSSFPISHDVRADSLANVYDVENRINSSLARAYAMYITRALEALEKRGGPKLAALVLEPLLMGAGGMIFVDPLFQRVLIDTVRGRRSGSSTSWSGLPVIFDEVFVGLHRIGMESTGPLLGVYPDISVNAKVLTGGLLPLAVTLASNSIFEAFLSDSKADALLHGHSYTAHPIGCEVANETLAILDKVTKSDEWVAAQQSWAKPDGTASPVWSLWDPHFIIAISKLPQVKEVMTLGCVLSIKIKDDASGYTSHSAQTLFQSLTRASQEDGTLSTAPGGAAFGMHFRTLGDVAYFMTSLNTSSTVIRSIEDKIWQTLNE
ncbi:Bifunctional dethiobiotin synthetase/adenosylmethionine-8-amino-7-oxononanoate aminotransferase [Psilocybe cubensis]|uniref:PLP-dependent transferase n=2 Tax=Psilocybe cubensis TaxID=181762 RepID=A0A8H7Y3M0_PSICU|nr:Bifunctional dethiobiotin synthetase/adenosylmethionine-8-amino-7-oxononanoate aminotransferase [Psilocybe cubensis]KAH9481691.1 Bifunctional dethiobiotin synthetase/adenosylmethionine-8-amino-7-oxononanoate aminotransferase [Psilocybe cubensis]